METTGQSDSIPEPGDFSSRIHFAALASEEQIELARILEAGSVSFE